MVNTGHLGKELNNGIAAQHFRCIWEPKAVFGLNAFVSSFLPQRVTERIVLGVSRRFGKTANPKSAKRADSRHFTVV